MLPRKYVDASDPIVLPDSLKFRVLNLAHFAWISGQPGQSMMLEGVRRNWYWTQMAAEIFVTLQNFPKCAKNHLRLRKSTNPLNIFLSIQPLESVGIDILGPLPRT